MMMHRCTTMQMSLTHWWCSCISCVTGCVRGVDLLLLLGNCIHPSKRVPVVRFSEPTPLPVRNLSELINDLGGLEPGSEWNIEATAPSPDVDEAADGTPPGILPFRMLMQRLVRLRVYGSIPGQPLQATILDSSGLRSTSLTSSPPFPSTWTSSLPAFRGRTTFSSSSASSASWGCSNWRATPPDWRSSSTRSRRALTNSCSSSSSSSSSSPPLSSTTPNGSSTTPATTSHPSPSDSGGSPWQPWATARWLRRHIWECLLGRSDHEVVTAVLTIALPVPVLVSNFALLQARAELTTLNGKHKLTLENIRILVAVSATMNVWTRPGSRVVWTALYWRKSVCMPAMRHEICEGWLLETSFEKSLDRSARKSHEESHRCETVYVRSVWQTIQAIVHWLEGITWKCKMRKTIQLWSVWWTIQFWSVRGRNIIMIVIHSGEYPYVCSECDYKCVEKKNNIVSHMKRLNRGRVYARSVMGHLRR